MPLRSPEPVRRQQDRDHREPPHRPDEPRHFDAAPHETATGHGAHAGFDADLNPIDDDDINTHGSER